MVGVVFLLHDTSDTQKVKFTVNFINYEGVTGDQKLVGGVFPHPSEKYLQPSNWIISPFLGVKIKK